MLLDKQKSCLVLIDVQEKLTPLVQEADKLQDRAQWMLRLADVLQVPIIVSEQYPKGLGQTVPALRSCVKNTSVLTKIYFSCFKDAAFQAYWKKQGRRQAVLIGIESHVCVLQTAIDMLTAGYEVSVVVDAISSRHALDHQIALERMKQAGVQLVTSEMVFFEWLQKAGDAQFKTLSQSFLK